MRAALAVLAFTLVPLTAEAATYNVGPGQTYASIGAVPWESLVAGDTVNIFWRATPYKEKWVIGVNGTSGAPITIHGVPDPGTGALPVIDGAGATTRTQLNFTNEVRAVIKIGTANVPNSTNPTYITIENLDVKSGRDSNTFTAANGTTMSYATNCAAIWVETGSNITIRNCVFEDSGNGFFSSSGSSNLLVEGCYYHDNGNNGSQFEHNNYTESDQIVFQYNHFGPLLPGSNGSNLKDRSAGTIIRFNWFEDGSRCCDLVDSVALKAQPNYLVTYVYGNVFNKSNTPGNSQVIHFGGDSGTTSDYRGTLHFYNNTVVSTRTGNTTIFRLSASGQTCDARNNILFATAGGSFLAMTNQDGVLDLRNNWLNTGYKATHGSLGAGASVNDLGGNVTGSAPGFTNTGAQDFTLAAGSPCIEAGTVLVAGAPAVDHAYVKHQQSQTRAIVGAVLDIGAYENGQSSGGGGGGGSGTPAISVTPSSLNFGTASVGSTVTAAITVSNPGTGTLSGSVTTQAPFSVVSGGSYALAAGASQVVVIQFAPTLTGNASGTATFTGGAGASVALSGVGGTASGGGNNNNGFVGGKHGGGGCAVARGGAPLDALPWLAFLFLVAMSRRRS